MKQIHAIEISWEHIGEVVLFSGYRGSMKVEGIRGKLDHYLIGEDWVGLCVNSYDPDDVCYLDLSDPVFIEA